VKNKLADLNDHLFAQLERLGDEDLTDEQMERESKRAEAIVSVADQVVKNADLKLKAAALLASHGYRIDTHLAGITSSPERLTLATVVEK
jgi:uncharacterized protein with ATP-grasp and redox domains